MQYSILNSSLIAVVLSQSSDTKFSLLTIENVKKVEKYLEIKAKLTAAINFMHHFHLITQIYSTHKLAVFMNNTSLRSICWVAFGSKSFVRSITDLLSIDLITERPFAESQSCSLHMSFAYVALKLVCAFC